jgi:hypothetical protein
VLEGIRTGQNHDHGNYAAYKLRNFHERKFPAIMALPARTVRRNTLIGITFPFSQSIEGPASRLGSA